MSIFETKKVEKDKVDLTLSEFIDRFASIYYINVTYRSNGSVDVWIANPKKTVDEE